MHAVEIEDIRKSFGQTEAVRGISLSVAEGELFGLIGPDGAGKTTLFRILATLLVPDGGAARVDGLDVVADFRLLRRRLGYMPGRFSLYPDLSVDENLKFFARVFGTTVEANYDWIRPIYSQLEPFKSRRAGALSGGMKQKLALSCALVHRPQILILDEPTTGVDAVSRTEFWDSLKGITSAGVTTLVSTPYMDEARQCDRVALVQQGSVLEVDRPSEIEARFETPLFAVVSTRRRHVLAVLRRHPAAHSVFPFGDAVHFAVVDHQLDAEAIRAYLANHDVADAKVRPISAGIEDVFMDRMRAA